MSPGAGRTSGSQFAMVGAREPYAMVTPALRARASSAAIAGTILPVQFGCRVQIGSTMSKMSKAVVAALKTTGTGSGGDGICSVRGDVAMAEIPDCKPPRCRLSPAQGGFVRATYNRVRQADAIAKS